MGSVVQSCRIGEADAALLAKQAKRRQVEVSTLSSLYLKEKALEEEYPGIGFRDAACGWKAISQSPTSRTCWMAAIACPKTLSCCRCYVSMAWSSWGLTGEPWPCMRDN